MIDPGAASPRGKAIGASDATGGWLGRATDKLDSARGPAADRLYGAADAIRDQAQSLFEHEAISERVADVAHDAADRIDQSAEYLERRKVAQMAQDVTALVRRNPVPSLLIAATVGFLCARAFRRD